MTGFGITMVGLSVLIQRRYAQICAEHDLTPAQAQLLCMIKDQPCGMRELAPLMGMERPGLTGLVIRAEKLGLVQRDSPGRDRRAVVVSTTPFGQKTVEALYADIDASVPDLLNDLPAAGRASFEHVLQALAEAMKSPMLHPKPGAC
ncbi:MarR family winged helix-turn-helix transcriptional regulator [Paractinoplanes lichenicola]|uniref:MarR family transcriptional regulator n=1 Tax=Paractinoplanes lichenicola TaxID=2802976 RepID=A0ABS1VHB4_9ACTN|nr:MarR family transcriptional regulator [Actinoplanes lichenicola]MBL7254073.1 MarR family transcriptional regulator [Actinoplanes lichenicola]